MSKIHKAMRLHTVYSKRYNRLMEKLEKSDIDPRELIKLVSATIKLYTK